MAGPNTAHHKWNIAATIEVDEKVARKGVQRGVVRIPGQVAIDVMETYCGQCRKTYEDVADEPCSAADSTEHLRGGPIGIRAKRNRAAVAAAAVVARPAVQPAPYQQVPVAAVLRPVPSIQPARPRRTRPAPHPAAQMLPFELDATLTG